MTHKVKGQLVQKHTNKRTDTTDFITRFANAVDNERGQESAEMKRTFEGVCDLHT